MYTAVIEKSRNAYGAFVPDVPGAVGMGDTEEQALASVAQSLAIQLAECQKNGESRPEPTPEGELQLDPSTIEPGYKLAQVEPALMNRVSLELEAQMHAQGLSQVQLAKRLGTSQPTVSRWLDPFYWGHTTDSLHRLGDALGLEVEVKFKKRSKRRAQPAQEAAGR